MDYLELIKFVIIPIFSFIVIPLSVWLYRRLEIKVDENEKRVAILETKYSTLDERVTNIKEDLKEIKSMLHEILSRK